jgi:hypothetical protein
MSNFRIKTPHAAVKIWNYVNRLAMGEVDPSDFEDTEPTIVSTFSCISLQTTKSKGDPAGTFQMVLAPNKNWISTISAGSWCAILMSNDPIAEGSLRKGSRRQVKMIGRIEAVRVQTQVADDGARTTLYYVSGVDWGYIFNNIVYTDNLLAAAGDPQLQGNDFAVMIRNMMFGEFGFPQSYAVKSNLATIISIFGKSVSPDLRQQGKDIARLPVAIYDFRVPKDLVSFLNIRDSEGKLLSFPSSIKINEFLSLITGSLAGYDEYNDGTESQGFINAASFQGQHSFWQLLLENNNSTLNELYCDLRWDLPDTPNKFDEEENGVQFALYNRIRPFSLANNLSQEASNNLTPEDKFKISIAENIRSPFLNVRTHEIDEVEVISVSAGLNWRDKFNFIEIKPDWSEFNTVQVWTKQKSQTVDEVAFTREGFRGFFSSTKQFPCKPGEASDDGTPTPAIPTIVGKEGADFNQLPGWVQLMREWYFDTHRTLNGTLTLHGIDEYIAVGDNIVFDLGLINPNTNFNAATDQLKDNKKIVSHVENIAHSFSISADGARTYTTVIQFVRGVVVQGVPRELELVGEGFIDQFTTELSDQAKDNTNNTVVSSVPEDPSPSGRE